MKQQPININLALAAVVAFVGYRLVSKVEAAGNPLTSTIGREAMPAWLTAANLAYKELLKRPPLPLSNGNFPTEKRFLSDVECFEIANVIAERLEGFKSDYEAVQSIFNQINTGVNDLRFIYACFGKRRLTTTSSPSTLFNWYRKKLKSSELIHARKFWKPTNIVPPL